MSDDATFPMQPQRRTRRDADPDDQETVLADQDAVTPPTMPLSDRSGWKPPQDPGFVRTDPASRPSPPPFQAPQPPPHQAPQPPPYQPPQPAYPPQGPQGSADQDAQTMMVSARPVPVFAWLVVVDCPDRGSIGKVHSLHPDTTTIGRVQGNGIVVQDETVSAQHARIRREAKEGQEPVYALFDMGSRNGIYVGDKSNYKDEGQRVYRHELHDGDYLLVGETTLVFKSL